MKTTPGRKPSASAQYLCCRPNAKRLATPCPQIIDACRAPADLAALPAASAPFSIIPTTINKRLFAFQQRASVHWSGRLDSNQRPHAPQACALPGCATSRHVHYFSICGNVLLSNTISVIFPGELSGRGRRLVVKPGNHLRRNRLNSTSPLSRTSKISRSCAAISRNAARSCWPNPF